MNEYIVSARKYRPRTFDTLIGQDNIARTLLNSIRRGQLAHAYLFCGPRGVGKTTTARIFARMINCSSPLENGDACGKCPSCVSFDEGSSYCIQEMDAASNNSVDDIKDLIDKVRIPPQVGKYSVYIIDEVHMLSQAAFNAFLKTLEEPPEHAIFILATTEKHKILPTILSRCQTYDFNRITVDNIVRNLRNIAEKEDVRIDDKSLHVIALKADGAMRDALTIFDQTVAFCGTDVKYEDVIHNLNVLDYEYSFSLVRNFLDGDYATALRTFDEILSKGFNALHFMSALSSHFRDLLVTKADGVDALLELAESVKAEYVKQASTCNEKFLYDALNLTMTCEQGYKMAINPRLHIEFCLMKLCFLCKAAATTPAATTTATATTTTPTTAATVATTTPTSATPTTAATATPTPAAATATLATPTTATMPAATTPAPTEKQKRQGEFDGIMALSLNEMKADNKAKEPVQVISDEASLPTQEAILMAWDKLCEASRPNLRLFNALTTAKLDTQEVDGTLLLTYSVVNEALKSWLEGHNSRIENKLRELAGSNKINIIVGLQEDPDAGKAILTQEEKARAMMEQNPVAKKIIADFELEIK